ncbi:hypothetical protein O6H91_10G006400 [Diphasiastrum complanatum]|uniref:Uncharacterized protein n=1 Tax=Diphasiastrum complanatum TaxID=34168 RepID=A0ACC2CEZ0_DIPCM|nr:hypothetical protein O6H91_10G006400 [Diphasiastrum complanatum]
MALLFFSFHDPKPSPSLTRPMMLLLLLPAIVAVAAAAAARIPSIGASPPLPFIVLHGISDECKHSGLTQFTQLLSEFSGASGFCIEIGNGASDSWFMPLTKQAENVCEQVKALPELQAGYNIVGLSQGNVIGRGVIEWCDEGPQVFNMVSLGGPHAGIASVPLCTVLSICALADVIMEMGGIYSTFAQNHFAPSGYMKIPTDLTAYYEGCAFLPKLNNEIPTSRNSSFKERFSKLNHLVLVKFENDTVLVPPETAWFGYFSPNATNSVLSFEETDLYKEDWIGLKVLKEKGGLTFLSFAGNHLTITKEQLQYQIAPYLTASSSPGIEPCTCATL